MNSIFEEANKMVECCGSIYAVKKYFHCSTGIQVITVYSRVYNTTTTKLLDMPIVECTVSLTRITSS